jgi:hypothetical protein
MDPIRGSSPTKNSASDSPEQLLDVFRAAALSVTKLYKTSAAAQAKARADGYQDCLEDLLLFLDKQNIGVGDGEGWQIRRWATERFDGRDPTTQSMESEDEVDRNEPASSPEVHRSDDNNNNNNNSNNNTTTATTTATTTVIAQPEPPMRTDSAPPAPTCTHQDSVSVSAPPTPAPVHEIVVPTQDSFTFQSSMAYPQDSDLSMANLDLSDNRSTATNPHHHPAHAFRSRNNKTVQRPRNSNIMSRSAGQKRKHINIAEIFDLGSIGGKDMFGGNGGGGGKRSRHA